MTDREEEFQTSWETLTTAFGLTPAQKREIYPFARCMFSDGWIAGKPTEPPRGSRRADFGDICPCWPTCSCDPFSDCKDGFSFKEKYGLGGKYKTGFGGGKYRIGARPR